jgi:hypothetical protein
MQPLKILFKYPCRGRENMFFESLDTLNDNIRDRENYLISLTIDTDDEILNTPSVIEKIEKYQNVKIEWGTSTSKIDAINRSMPDYDWDIVVCWSNDMFATFHGFDDVFREAITQAFINDGLDGLIHFPEQDTKELLNVLYIATKKYYDRFGYIYHPSYKSLWCDNETMEVAKILGKYNYCGIPNLYMHKNPAYGHYNIERDEMFDKQQSYWVVDETNFRERQLRNFDLNL